MGMKPFTHDSGARAGLVLALVSATTFGTSGAVARGLLDAGWTAGAAVTARICVAALVLVVPGLMALRGRWSLLRANGGLILTYGVVAVAGAQLCYFYAVSRLDVGLALLLEFTAPLAVVAWWWARHGHRPSRLTALGAAVTMAGLVLLLDLVGGGADLDLLGVAWALAAMLGAATYFVISADLGNGLPPLTLASGGLVVGGVVLALVGAVGLLPMEMNTSPVAYSGFEVPWLVPVLALSVVAGALAYVSGIAAGRRLGSRLASFVALFEVVAALAFAWLLLDQLPGVVQMVGGVVILVGVILVKTGETPSRGGGTGSARAGRADEVPVA